MTWKNVFTARNSKSQTCVEIGLLNIKTLFFLYLTKEYPVLFSQFSLFLPWTFLLTELLNISQNKHNKHLSHCHDSGQIVKGFSSSYHLA